MNDSLFFPLIAAAMSGRKLYMLGGYHQAQGNLIISYLNFLNHFARVILNGVKELCSIYLTKFLYPLYKASLRLCESLFSPIDKAKFC
jgi:hypothetical protein